MSSGRAPSPISTEATEFNERRTRKPGGGYWSYGLRGLLALLHGAVTAPVMVVDEAITWFVSRIDSRRREQVFVELERDFKPEHRTYIAVKTLVNIVLQDRLDRHAAAAGAP